MWQKLAFSSQRTPARVFGLYIRPLGYIDLHSQILECVGIFLHFLGHQDLINLIKELP